MALDELRTDTHIAEALGFACLGLVELTKGDLEMNAANKLLETIQRVKDEP